MTDPQGVLVVAEVRDGVPTPLAHELLGLGRRLVECFDGDVSAVAFVPEAGDGLGDVLISHGADRVFLAQDQAFLHGSSEAYLAVLESLARDLKPSVITFGHTTLGSELAPRLAYRLGAGVVTDCLDATVDDGRLLFTRSCLGGKANEVVCCHTSPAVATFKSRSQVALAPDPSRRGEIALLAHKADPDCMRVKVLERQPGRHEGQNLQDAGIVVAGGRGLRGKDGFDLATQLAQLLDGAVGATRAACDMGWCSYGNQIGASGVTVAPDLYIAIGVSGAGHHMVGCLSAKIIVAINNDPDAAIFSFARFGLVGDCRTILPALIDEMRRLKG